MKPGLSPGGFATFACVPQQSLTLPLPNVKGGLLEDATFFGYLGYEPAPFQFTDPDDGGAYIGSTPQGLLPAGDMQLASILQGAEVRESQVGGTSPGEPTYVLNNFGELTYEEDAALSIGVLCEDEGDPGAGLLAAWPTLYEALFRPANGATTMVRDVGALLVGGLLVCTSAGRTDKTVVRREARETTRKCVPEVSTQYWTCARLVFRIAG